MKYKFSKESTKNIRELEPPLQAILMAFMGLQIMDIKVICGHRDMEAQNEAYDYHASNHVFPDSKHNKLPSLAFDVVPYPLDWGDTNRFARMLGIIETIAKFMHIQIRLGRDFKKPKDWGHVELVSSENNISMKKEICEY